MSWTPEARAKRHPPLTDAQYIERMWTRTVKRGECWVWTGTFSSLNYGQISYRNKMWATHRLSYTLHKGPIPAGMQVCHTCDNPTCWNPDHLWLGTASDNVSDSKAKNRHAMAAKTHCIRGHAYAEFGYVQPNGKRKCAACDAGRWERERQGKGVPNRDKTHCIHGHPLSGDNLYVNPNNGRRQCKQCRLDGIRRLQVKRRSERVSVRESV